MKNRRFWHISRSFAAPVQFFNGGMRWLLGLGMAIAFLLTTGSGLAGLGPMPVALASAASADDAAAAEALRPSDEQLQRSTSLGADDISAEKVSQFVRAYSQVLALVNARADDLRRVETEAESLNLQRSLEQEALDSIEATGLTWQEYVQLLNLANTDPAFGERIVAQLQETSD